jgi:hypothetical protein
MMKAKPEELEPKNEKKTVDPIDAEPVAEPSPPMDGKKPIPAGDSAVEKFLVATDTEGGD